MGPRSGPRVSRLSPWPAFFTKAPLRCDRRGRAPGSPRNPHTKCRRSYPPWPRMAKRHLGRGVLGGRGPCETGKWPKLTTPSKPKWNNFGLESRELSGTESWSHIWLVPNNLSDGIQITYGLSTWGAWIFCTWWSCFAGPKMSAWPSPKKCLFRFGDPYPAGWVQFNLQTTNCQLLSCKRQQPPANWPLQWNVTHIFSVSIAIYGWWYQCQIPHKYVLKPLATLIWHRTIPIAAREFAEMIAHE